ncbi:MAG: uroporphyrinogen decarboxylase family protein [Caldilineaceae bacterium]|nr:uroporphyrinogen decarboxylase family protein [Caldilineaceae bacterium]
MPTQLVTTLTSRDRVLAAIRRQPTDCVVAMPYMYDIAPINTGVALRDYYTNPAALAHAQVAFQAMAGQDVIAIGADNFYIAEGFGCKTTRSEDEVPSLVEPPCSDLMQVYDLAVPDPHTDGRMPVMLEALRLARQAVGDAVALRSPGTGPFALASYFIGSQEWLMEVGMVEGGLDEGGEKEAALHHALGLASDALIAFGKACWDAGADILHCGDSLASCNVISPHTFQRFSFPYLQKVFSAWADYGIDRKLLHICGNSTKVLELYAATGADMVEIDHAVDLRVAKQRIGDKIILIGNVHTVEELLQGTPETVTAAANRCIDHAGAGGGFMLGSGCIVPRYTPLENVQAMVAAAHSRTYPPAG